MAKKPNGAGGKPSQQTGHADSEQEQSGEDKTGPLAAAPSAEPGGGQTPPTREENQGLADKIGSKAHERRWPSVDFKWWHDLAVDRRVELFFALCLVAFTLGQVYYGKLQWNATSDQYRAMIGQIELQRRDQRPWISFDTPKVQEPTAGEKVHCTIEWTNVGKTPCFAFSDGARAFIVSIPENGAEIDLLEQVPKVPSPPPDSPGEWQTPIHPGKGFGTFLDTEEVMDDEKINGLVRGRYKLLIFAACKYLDQDGNPHSTVSCWYYDPEMKRCATFAKYNSLD